MATSRAAWILIFALSSAGAVGTASAQGLTGALSTPLRQGARGEAVRELQRTLNVHRAAVGLSPIAVDGAFGPQTDTAVREFQRSADLSVDGVVGPLTAAALTQAPALPIAPPPPPPSGGAPRLQLPVRASGAVTGSRFVGRVAGQSVSAREAALLAEVARGNVPSFLRTLRPVTLEGNDRTGQRRRVTLWVTPDYVSVGSDLDFVRFPMTPMTAQRIADRTGCLLPTTRVVDAVYRKAEVKLAPIPLTPDATMVLPRTFLRHHQRVERQRISRGARLGLLLAGHKKDVVNSRRLLSRPTQVAIYGWHRTNGQPIQPLSLVHGRSYVDYSHGIRLVHATAFVDGSPRSLAAVLRDPDLAHLVSSEGTLPNARLP